MWKVKAFMIPNKELKIICCFYNDKESGRLLRITAGVRVQDKPLPTTNTAATSKTPAPPVVDENDVVETVVEPRPTPL